MQKPLLTDLTPRQINEWEPFRHHPEDGNLAHPLIERLKAASQWHARQLAGRRWAMGCVALEITQRCNLDCTLCYLSEHSEEVKDIPLAEVFRRIKMIFRHYGPRTEVQVTGGDPTLRRRDELVAIVRKIHESGMLPSLFTNGIRATRELLRELADNGLRDVVFHVDMTQQRKGYENEQALNALRKSYMDRARGLRLRVIFNTTVFAGNLAEVPRIVGFFRKHARQISMASFQLQADTGRSVLGRRAPTISLDSVAALISQGAGTTIDFGAAHVGHSKCNRYAVCLEAGGNLYNLYDNSPFMQKLFEALGDGTFDRLRPMPAIWEVLSALLTRPSCWSEAARYFAGRLWEMSGGLLKSRGRVHKLSFFIHNFMDAAGLDADRCRTCVFMVATQDGPLSMCLHNAKRDAYLMRPLVLDTPQGREWWQPLTGRAVRLAASAEPSTPSFPAKGSGAGRRSRHAQNG